MSVRELAARPTLYGALVIFAACSGPEPRMQAAPPAAHSPGSFGGPSRQVDFRAMLELPEPVHSELIALADALGAEACRLAQGCCPRYGYAPRSDCAKLADEMLLIVGSSAEQLAAEGRTVSLDAEWVARCKQYVAEVSSRCEHTVEEVAWWVPCRQALRFHEAGEPADQCGSDDDCVFLRGTRQACVEGRCVPTATVGLGASCESSAEAATAPVCDELSYCDESSGAPTCVEKLSAGASCYAGDDSCMPGLACVGLRCGTLAAEGAACQFDLDCAAGLGCDNLKASPGRCAPFARDRRSGESCTTHGDCISDPCADGTCTSATFVHGLCDPPSIDTIPDERALLALTEAEAAGVCAWAEGVFSSIDCMGVPVLSGGCQRIEDSACRASVRDYRRCLPELAETFDDCALGAAASLDEVRELIARTAGCEALVHCVEMMRSGS